MARAGGRHAFVLALIPFLFLSLGPAQATEMAHPPDDKARGPVRPIESVLRDHKPRLLALDGVVGVGRGLCRGRPCIKVMVRERTPGLVDQIGRAIEGFDVEIIETGPIRAL